MPKPLNVRLPDDLLTRLDAYSDLLVQKTGGVKMDRSKVVCHLLDLGLGVVELQARKEVERGG